MQLKQILFFLVIASMLTGCGAKDIHDAMKQTKEAETITLDMSYEKAFSVASLSEYATSTYSKSVMDTHAKNAFIWYGSEDYGVFAVIKFEETSEYQCKVSFYDYKGKWGDRLEGIRNLLVSQSD